MPGNSGDNITAALGLDGLDLIPNDGADEQDQGGEGDEGELESTYDLSEPPGEEDEITESDTPAGRKQLVPLGALQKERQQRQEAQARLQEEAIRVARIEERFQMLMQAQQGQQQQASQEEAIPDFNDDPAGHVAGITKQFQQRMAEMQEFVKQSQGANSAQQQHVQLAQEASAAEAEFVKRQPDYNEAAGYFQQRKLAEYTALGLDAVSAQQQLARDCAGLVQFAKQNGKNPAETLYNLAKAVGYTAQKASPQQQAQGQQQAPKKAPTSLANLNGAAKAPDEDQGGAMTVDRIARMSDADFDKFFKEMGKGSVQRPKF